jgi:rubrerythrin
MDLKGSQTEQNLMLAFVGESQARNRYTYYSGAARNEGFIQIANIFEETANQEKEHAKRFFKFLKGGEVTIQCAFPAGVIGTTAENLQVAATGEREEWTIVYPGFAAIAKQEGFPTIAVVLENILVAEKHHEQRYLGLLESLRNGWTFKRPQPTVWRCINCGYVHEGAEAPAACPACAHPQAYFELLAQNW